MVVKLELKEEMEKGSGGKEVAKVGGVGGGRPVRGLRREEEAGWALAMMTDYGEGEGGGV